MKLATCQCDPGGTISVQGQGYGATFGRGATVDLAAPVAEGQTLTWEMALGRYVELFTPIEPVRQLPVSRAKKSAEPTEGTGD